jgi:putative DNA primase/helicase
MLNGLLYVDGGEPVLVKHSPEVFVTTCLPYAYDPKATCWRWLRFLWQTFAGMPRERRRAIISHLQEWFGLNLVFNSGFQRLLVLWGQGGTGKSTIIQALIDMLGYENVSTVTLRGLANRFGVAQTVGKLANIVGDMGIGERIDSGVLKDMVSGGLIQVEEKYKMPYSFYSTVRFTFCANQPPMVEDSEDGFWRRVDMIECPNVVTTPNLAMCQPGYWQGIGELAGIFNWALMGYLRLMARGKMLRPPGSEEEVEELRRASDPLGAFITANVVPDSDGEVNMGVLYEDFKKAMKGTSYQYKVPVPAAFWKQVRRRFPGLPKRHQRRVNGVQQYFQGGLRRI